MLQLCLRSNAGYHTNPQVSQQENNRARKKTKRKRRDISDACMTQPSKYKQKKVPRSRMHNLFSPFPILTTNTPNSPVPDICNATQQRRDPI